MYNIEDLTEQARRSGASDIHLVCGLPPKYRLDGQLENMAEERLSEKDCDMLCQDLAKDAMYEKLEYTGELDFSREIRGIRCRCHVFKQQGKVSAAIRLLSESIPRLDSLGLPPSALEFTSLHKGIVLVTGETGSGKSTTLAAMLDEINHTRKNHIVTLEDPIEYVYTPDLCVINQREVGKDTASFSEGLRASLREDPVKCETRIPLRLRSQQPRPDTLYLEPCTQAVLPTLLTVWCRFFRKECRTRSVCSFP